MYVCMYVCLYIYVLVYVLIGVIGADLCTLGQVPEVIREIR